MSVPPLGYGFHLTNTPLPPLQEVLENLFTVEIPMTVTFRGVNSRQSALICGPHGWGEFAPFLEYGPQESAAWLACALEAAWLPTPEPVRTRIPLNATLPAVPAERVPEVLAKYAGDIQELKIKVAEKGQSLADDIARVAAAREALPNARLKVDANMGYTFAGALDALRKLCEYGIIYAEQPVASIEDMAALRFAIAKEGQPARIAADESIRKAEDPLKVARANAADLMVIKAAPLGGVRRALALVEQAQLPAVVSSALESSVGIGVGASLAASLPTLRYGCGLGTVSLMAEDVTDEPLIARDGFMDLRTITPSPQRLERLATDEQTRQWWVERVTACYRVLERTADL
ncbi:O-succinylbenzoate synthase [Rothia sp. HMSC078H08]|uniref:o-succinylbenzoate synthase n=1 Tax=Rothia sp. HMSC078H08 TaxID=1715008 RepID=UPI0008A187A5|nr:o-succinylbenzoate synthase [Rothia sp. HMSC078H08]OFN70088.1 O-succinylbenzoate synthase [Rothia sp. HMSC078H08]